MHESYFLLVLVDTTTVELLWVYPSAHLFWELVLEPNYLKIFLTACRVCSVDTVDNLIKIPHYILVGR